MIQLVRLLQVLIRLEWPLRLLAPAFGKFHPFRREFRENPYPYYRALREATPVYRHPLLRSWILTRFADVERVLRAPDFSVDRTRARIFRTLNPFAGISPEFVAMIRSTLLMQDPPDHTRLRSLVNRAFTPRAVEKLRPRVAALVDELLDPLATRGEFELVHDFAVPLPLIVISELLGVPRADRARFKEWSDALTVLLDPLQASSPGGIRGLEVMFEEIRRYFSALFADRRRAPRDDLISALVAVEEAGERLSEAELLALCMLILGAGHETTTNLLGNALCALLRNPAERRRLQDDPELAESAVEEFLRYDSPVQLTDRVVLHDLQIAGRPIRAGSIVVLILGAANRDPAQFAEPERLDLGRSENRHQAFGSGVHFCLGAPLARLEAQIAIPALLRRFPDLDGDPSRIEWKRSLVLRGPLTLPLRTRRAPLTG